MAEHVSDIALATTKISQFLPEGGDDGEEGEADES
jgi:hypothetical protein